MKNIIRYGGQVKNITIEDTIKLKIKTIEGKIKIKHRGKEKEKIIIGRKTQLPFRILTLF